MNADSNDIIFTSYGVDLRFFLEGLITFMGGNPVSWEGFLNFFGGLWTTFSVISFILSALCIIGYIYATIRYNQVSVLEAEMVSTQERLWQELYGQDAKGSRWEEVMRHLDAENPNDWKIAIIEADIMLEDALEKAGFPGNTTGERLKSGSPETFKTLDDAWKAHRVRNSIAHARDDFVLTKKIAKETLLQYQRVLTEFKVI